MKTVVFINPLKPGKLKEYKAFSAENTGPRKREYIDLLHRYGMRNVKVYYHKLWGKEQGDCMKNLLTSNYFLSVLCLSFD